MSRAFQGCTLRKLPDRVMVWMWMTARDAAAPRILIVNLSERLRQFHHALVSVRSQGFGNVDACLTAVRSKLDLGVNRILVA